MKKKSGFCFQLEGETYDKKFIELLQTMMEDGIFTSYCFSSDAYCIKITSATKVQKKIIGIRDDETGSLFLFPDLLIKRWKKESRRRCWPMVFFRKKELLEVLRLVDEDLIIRTEDGSAVHKVFYHNKAVRAWKLNRARFSKLCIKPTNI